MEMKYSEMIQEDIVSPEMSLWQMEPEHRRTKEQVCW